MKLLTRRADISLVFLGWALGAILTFTGHGLLALTGLVDSAWWFMLFTLANAGAASLAYLWMIGAHLVAEEKDLEKWYRRNYHRPWESLGSRPADLTVPGVMDSKDSSVNKPGPVTKPSASLDASQAPIPKDD